MAVILYLFDPQLELLGTIPDPVEVIHKEASYQLTAQFKTLGKPTSGYCIGLKCLDHAFRIFEIDEIDFRDDTGDCFVTCTDRAVRELTDIVVTDVHCDGMTVMAALQHLIDETSAGWTLGPAITTDGATTRHYYCTMWASILKLMDKYGVRIVPYFRFNPTTCAITDRLLRIESLTPEFCGRLVESGDGASNVVVRISGNPKTALYGRGKGEQVGETESGDATYGRRINFSDVVWTTADGYPVNKPAGQEWVGDPAAQALFGRSGKHRFDVVIFDDVEDPAELLQKTWDYLQTICYPTITATAALFDLEMVKGYSYAAVRVGHEVIIRPKQYAADFRSTITEIERNYTNPANTRITISNGSLSGGRTAGTVINSMVSNTMEQSGVITRNSVIDTMVTTILSSGTKMYTDPNYDGAWVFENSAGTTAMMLTGGGWMIADSKTGDQWNWVTAASGGGMVSSDVTTGTLNASVIQIFGSDHFYWDAENIYIRESVFDDLTLANVRYQVGTDRTVTDIYPIVDESSWTNDTTVFFNLLAEGFNAGRYRLSFDTYSMPNRPTLSSFTIYYYSHGTKYTRTVQPVERDDFQLYINFPYDSTEDSANSIGIEVPVRGTYYTYVITNLQFALIDTYVVTDWTEPTVLHSSLLCSSGYTEVTPTALAAGKYRLLYDSVTPDGVDDYQLIAQTSGGTDTELGPISNTNLQIDFTLSSAQTLYVLGTVSLREIRIGKYNGVDYGIGYTTDGGVTWQTAIDFNGLAFSGEAVSLRTSNSSVDIHDGFFNVYAGSQVTFQTDAYSVRNAAGRSLISISSDENREGQVVLGEDGFPVTFGGGFILPVKNGGTGYAFGQTHRVRAIPSSGFGEDGDLAVYYAGANTSYSAFGLTVTGADSFAASNIYVAGFQRRWNNFYNINNAIPAGYWAIGNDAGYPYGVYGTFVSPVDITGGLTVEMVIGKYVGGNTYGKANGTTLLGMLCQQDGTVMAQTTFTPPDREEQTVTLTFNVDATMTANTTYLIAMCDISDQVTWSYALVQMGSITVPGSSGSATYGLFVKSGGQWHEIGGAS